MANGAVPRARIDQWTGDTPERVLRFVADDLDEHDRRFTSLERELAAIKKLMIGILISTTTASVLLVLNLGIGGSV